MIFLKLNYAFGSIFLIEYLARLYAVGIDSRFSGISGRIKYIFSFYALIDLIAFLPFLIFPSINESFLLRFLRIFRLFSLLKTSKHAKGLILIGQVVKDKMYELLFSIAITFGVIFIALLFYTLETLLVFGVVYILSIPVSLFIYNNLNKKDLKKISEEDHEDIL